jgi:cell division protein FtsN
MNQYSSDSGFQLIIDNRKIVIAGVFLLLVCGAFFVIGYMEGKRQGIRSAENSAMAGTPSGGLQSQARPDKAGDQSKTDENPVRDQLSWYNDVNKSGKAPVQGLEAKRTETASGTGSGSGSTAVSGELPAKSENPRPSEPAKTGQVTYSVQIGAFKYRKEAETKAAELKAKKYNSIIEAPSDSEQLFLLKVGRFESRADAVAAQNRLKKDGFKTFIKTNK